MFCPKAKKLVYLEDLPDNVLSKLCSPRAEELRFIGPFLEDDIAHGIARGDLCPLSKAKMVDIAPDVDQHTAPYRPTTTGAKGTIKDFFGPAPAGNKNSTNARKRHALGEISSNNLFSMKKAEAVDKQALRARPVKSRFFTPATRQMPSKVDIVTIEDSGDDEARHHPQRHLDRATCTPFDHRLGASSDAAESFIGSTSKQANPPMTHARKGAQASLEDDTVMNAYPPPNYTSLYTGLENDLFPEALPSVHTGDRPKIASGITLPPMPVPAPPIAPQEEELDGLWECHALSSPNDEEISSRPRKLRRYSSPFTPSKRKRSSVEEMSENVQNCELLTSPVTDVSLEVTAQHIQIGLTKQVALPSGSTDLTDYSSPRSITRDVRQSGTVQGRNKHCADEAQGSEDSLWSDEAVTPDASLQIERSTCTAPKHSVSNRKHATALQRSDAVRSTPDLDDLPEGRIFADSREAGFDKRMTSVIAGWRQKFAPLSSKRKRQTRDISQMLPSQCHAPQHLLSPVRNRKQEACNLPPTSSPNVVHRPPLFSTNVTQDDVLRSTSMSKDGKTDRSRTSLSQSTARALEAFRFKPN